MILKLILIAIVLVSIYRFMGGSFSLSSPKKPEGETEADALEECETCGTYVTRKECHIHKGKYYCSKECLPN